MKSFLRTRSIRLVAALAVASGTAGLASLTALSTTSAQADPSSTTGLGRGGCRRHPGLLRGTERCRRPPTRPPRQFYTPLHSSAATDNTDHPVLRRLPRRVARPSTRAASPPRPAARPSTGPTPPPTASPPCGRDQRHRLGEHLGLVHQRRGQRDRPDRLRPGRPGPEDRGHLLTFIPYGRDAVALSSYFDHGDGALNTLTTAQLKSHLLEHHRPPPSAVTPSKPA